MSFEGFIDRFDEGDGQFGRFQIFTFNASVIEVGQKDLRINVHAKVSVCGT
jgi:hypothetical protein